MTHLWFVFLLGTQRCALQYHSKGSPPSGKIISPNAMIFLGSYFYRMWQPFLKSEEFFKTLLLSVYFQDKLLIVINVNNLYEPPRGTE